MLQIFRNFFSSRIGIGITLALLALIALAFASGDVANNSMFGGVAGGDRVASVGHETLSAADLNRSANSALERVKQNDPTLTMPYFIKQGGLERVLDDLIDRYALGAFGDKSGLRAGHRLIDSEIAMVGAFKGADGKFDETIYRQALAQQNLNDAMVRADLRQGLLARQILIPATFGLSMPDQQVERYATLLKERRSGSIAVLPSLAYAPKDKPTDEQLTAYYAESKDNYIRPERRVIRYVTFGADALGDLRKPTDAEIAARFKRDAAQYAATETRTFSQVIVPTQAAANALAAEANAGRSLEAAAKAKGLAAAKLSSMDKAALATQASQAVADAAFAASAGKIATPQRSNLGWHVLRVDSAVKTAAKPLSQVSGAIAAELAAEQQQAALADLTARLEDAFDEGTSLADAAKEVGGEIKTTPQLTANGGVYGKRNEGGPAVLAPALATAFTMEEGEPQIAEIMSGQTFLLFDVAEIVPSAPAPLKEIKDEVAEAWTFAQGSAEARKAANRVLAKIGKGSTLAAALAEEKKPLPAPDKVNLGLEDLRKMGDRPPAPVVLLFSMAQGSTKRLAGPDDRGWFIIQLDKITEGKLEKDDPAIAITRQQLATSIEEEYSDQLIKAIRKDVGVVKNEAGIDAVRRQLSGE